MPQWKHTILKDCSPPPVEDLSLVSEINVSQANHLEAGPMHGIVGFDASL
jgi:hypothetical protein